MKVKWIAFTLNGQPYYMSDKVLSDMGEAGMKKYLRKLLNGDGVRSVRAAKVKIGDRVPWQWPVSNYSPSWALEVIEIHRKSLLK